MAYLTYEGTKDFLVMTPALIVTFRASGSITAGRLVCLDAGGTAEVAQITATGGGAIPVGVALKTCADEDPVPVCVWGFLKNLVMANSAETIVFGENISVSGSGLFTSGSAYTVGRLVSGSATSFMAFIDCMRVYTSD